MLLGTLSLLERPQELYQIASEKNRRILNRAIFSKLLVDHDGEAPFVSGDELNEPFDSVITYQRQEFRSYRRLSVKNGAQYLSAVPDHNPLAALLALLLVTRVRVSLQWWGFCASRQGLIRAQVTAMTRLV